MTDKEHKKNLRRTVKELAQTAKEVEQEERAPLAVIRVNASPDVLESPFSPDLSEGGVGDEFCAYLTEQVQKIPLSVSPRIELLHVEEEAQPCVVHAIRETFKDRILRKRRTLRRNNSIALVLFIAGVLLTGVCLYLSVRGKYDYFNEVMLVIAGFFIWTASDLFFLQRPSVRIEQLACARIYKAEFFFPPCGEENSPAE